MCRTKDLAISMIAAVSRNGVIGANNKLPWRIKSDLEHFKQATTGKVIMMGSKTFKSLGRPLPNRRNVVISRKLKRDDLPGAEVHQSPQIFMDRGILKGEELMVIGGGEIYSLMMPYAKTLIISEVDIEVKGDTTFPDINLYEWKLEDVRTPEQPEGETKYVIKTYVRQRPH